MTTKGDTTMTKTTIRGMTRDELTDAALAYVRAGGRDTSEATAEQIVDAAVDSMLGREDVQELRAEAGDVEIVVGALKQFVAQAIEDEQA